MPRIKFLLFLLALAAQVPLASATVTYVVGSCKPSLPSFTTIMGALGATPAPNVVEVCPGNYPEQVMITNPVILEGISAANFTRAVITVPPGGLLANATSTGGDRLAAQVLVENDAAGVNLTNLTVDGTGNNGTAFLPPWIVGVFYQNSAGTMNHLTVRNQNGNGLGFGVWLEGGSASPSVTLENSNIQGFDDAGIVWDTDSSPGEPELTVTVKGNYVSAGPAFCSSGECSAPIGIAIEQGATASVSSNLITGGNTGMTISGGEGSVSKNTVVSSGLGIRNYFGLPTWSVTSNTIYDTGTGIGGFLGNTQVTGNAIIQSNDAFDFECNTATNTHSNTILGAANGLANVPSGVLTTETYYNVGTIRTGGC